jgi:hypothetical protein
MDNFTFAGFQFPRHIAQLVRLDYCGSVPAHRRAPGNRHKFKVSTSYYGSPTPNLGRNDTFGFYLDSDFAPGLRWQWCDQACPGIDHTGWFTDEDQHDTLRGIVYRLPHGRGFLAGWAMQGMGECVTIWREVHKCERDAARMADEHARVAAEQEREYREKQQADEDALEVTSDEWEAN